MENKEHVKGLSVDLYRDSPEGPKSLSLTVWSLEMFTAKESDKLYIFVSQKLSEMQRYVEKIVSEGGK